eukprot:TRINITY_DN13910_c0_g1_i1.p1 TRINITY_DN13910_c0_g1~~TRINITY_DN13910_c0_g1_i1.p1  ORF type:complete len:366 (+),score=85.48 TRINITY_DN13910_c0_g1_i1:83-1099(+)
MAEEVRLVVYRLTCPTWLRAIGFGAWHAGIAVYGTEYSYVCQKGSGLLRSRPRHAFDQSRLHEDRLLGHTSKSKDEVRALVRVYGKEWRGRDFDSLTQNCCHFCKSFARDLGGFRTPRYINRAANCAACCVPRSCIDWIMVKWFERRSKQKHLLKERADRLMEERMWRPALPDELVEDRPGCLRARSPGGRWRPLTVVKVNGDGSLAVRAAQPDGAAGDDWDSVDPSVIQCNRFRISDRVASKEPGTVSTQDGWVLRSGEGGTVVDLDEDGDIRLANPAGQVSPWLYAASYQHSLGWEGSSVAGTISAAALAAAAVAAQAARSEFRTPLPGQVREHSS